MQPAVPFPELMRRIRQGDAEAASFLVRQYEKEILRVIRTHLNDERMRRTLDSMDICQSVLGNFFVRAAAGQFDLEDPRQLIKLLQTMAKNKLLDKVREQQAERRDNRRMEAGGQAVLEAVPGGGETPSEVVAVEELKARAREILTPEERRLAELRTQGRSWEEVAAEVGGTADGVRKQLERAMNRVVRQLRLGSDVEE